MPRVYTPLIVTDIPSDIDKSQHAGIEAKLDAARKSLRRVNSYSCGAAMVAAAVAISQSGVGACGYPSVKVTRGR